MPCLACRSIEIRTYKVKSATRADGTLALLHKELAAEAAHWIDQTRLDPDDRLIRHCEVIITGLL
jgi:hypothetical protein